MNALSAYALANEMGSLLENASIEDVFSYPDAVSIEVSGSPFSFINIVRLKSSVDIAFSDDSIAPGLSESMSTSAIRGAVVKGVRPIGFDRTLEIDLAREDQWGKRSEFEMSICLIPHMARVSVRNKHEGTHVETFPLGSGRGAKTDVSALKEKSFSLLHPEEITGSALPGSDAEEIGEEKQAQIPEHTLAWKQKKKLAASLVSNISGIDPVLATAIADQAKGDPDAAAEIIREIAESMERNDWRWHMYDFPNEGERGISVIYPIELPVNLEGKKFGSVYDALLERYDNVTMPSYTAMLRERLTRSMHRELAKLERIQVNLSRDIDAASRARDFRHMGNLLATYRHLLRTGMKSITVKDLSGEKNITITLDPSRSIDANIKDYFNRARKGERGIIVMRERRKQIERLIREKKKAIADVENMTDPYEIVSAASSLMKTRSKEVKKESSEKRFRVFELDDKHKVIVGRNDKENDLLTHRYASPRDLWFHAQGVAGSHVILKGATSSTPKVIIEKAAEIAAYFSKAKHSAMVPVIYTEKRYVRKPRRSKAGAASVERGKTIFVSPRIPDSKMSRSRPDQS